MGVKLGWAGVLRLEGQTPLPFPNLFYIWFGLGIQEQQSPFVQPQPGGRFGPFASPTMPGWVGGGLKLAVEVPLLGQSCAPARFSLSAADGPVGMAPPSPFPSLACGAGCEDSEVAEEQEGGPVLGSSHLLPYL